MKSKLKKSTKRKKKKLPISNSLEVALERTKIENEINKLRNEIFVPIKEEWKVALFNKEKSFLVQFKRISILVGIFLSLYFLESLFFNLFNSFPLSFFFLRIEIISE